jgi:hypothetical protein
MARTRLHQPSVMPGLGLDLLAGAIVLAGALVAHWLWPERSEGESLDPLSTVPALTMLGFALIAAVACEVGAMLLRAAQRVIEAMPQLPEDEA